MLLTTWQIIKLIIWGIIIINEIAALYTVFREKRDIAATWAWLLVLTLIPVLGFILYAFLGRKLPQDKMERIQSQTELELSAALEEDHAHVSTDDHAVSKHRQRVFDPA